MWCHPGGLGMKGQGPGQSCAQGHGLTYGTLRPCTQHLLLGSGSGTGVRLSQRPWVAAPGLGSASCQASEAVGQWVGRGLEASCPCLDNGVHPQVHALGICHHSNRKSPMSSQGLWRPLEVILHRNGTAGSSPQTRLTWAPSLPLRGALAELDLTPALSWGSPGLKASTGTIYL